jgi:hypothetical protein
LKAIFLATVLLALSPLAHAAGAQSSPEPFPLAGDWEGIMVLQGATNHLVLHMNTTPEGKMTALLDFVDRKISGVPAIGGSFDGSKLILRFSYWKPNSSGDLVYRVSSYEATINDAGSEMTGAWAQEGSSALNFKRLTWQAKVPRPAPPTIFDGDWAGIEYESRGIKLHFIFHMHNTEDGLMVLLDCPEERFKGALASKVSYDQESRQISIVLGMSTFTGKMTADGKSLDTSMTEPGFHFEIHFDRQETKKPRPN